MANVSAPVYQLRIHLRGVSPPIWRRILVSSESTIAELHAVIQAVMGWEDIHLHQFTIRGQWYGVPRDGALCFHAGTEYLRLFEFDFRTHEPLSYDYDFHSRVLPSLTAAEMPKNGGRSEGYARIRARRRQDTEK